MMDQETWLRRILATIQDLADRDYQERIWIRGEGPEADSSTEAICRLVHDYDLQGFLARAGAARWLSQAELEALQNLERSVSWYLTHHCTPADDAARLVTPEWRRLRCLAQRTMDTFALRRQLPAS